MTENRTCVYDFSSGNESCVSGCGIMENRYSAGKYCRECGGRIIGRATQSTMPTPISDYARELGGKLIHLEGEIAVALTEPQLNALLQEERRRVAWWYVSQRATLLDIGKVASIILEGPACSLSSPDHHIWAPDPEFLKEKING